MSIPALDKITPDRPPIVNKKIKPKVYNIGASQIQINTGYVNDANQLKTFIPVGTAIIIVAAVK